VLKQRCVVCFWLDCWRSYLARTAVRRIVEHRAALDVQHFGRGVMGRASATEVRRIA